jgi:hypothetical protein
MREIVADIVTQVLKIHVLKNLVKITKVKNLKSNQRQPETLLMGQLQNSTASLELTN